MTATDTGRNSHFGPQVTANTAANHALILITPRGRHDRREAGVTARRLTADTHHGHGPKQPPQTANSGRPPTRAEAAAAAAQEAAQELGGAMAGSADSRDPEVLGDTAPEEHAGAAGRPPAHAATGEADVGAPEPTGGASESRQAAEEEAAEEAAEQAAEET